MKKNSIKKKFLWKKQIAIILLCIIAFLCCYPLLFLWAGSMMGDWELKRYLGAVIGGSGSTVHFSFMPLYPTLKSYVALLLDTPEYFVMFWNSVKITGGILAGQLFVGVPAAWAFARYPFPARKSLFTLYMVLMMMPFQVTMLSNYLVLDKMHLMNTQFSIILPGIFSTFPVFLMYRFFESIPEEILEAARIDGAGEWRIFLHFGVPLGSAGIISSTVLGFLEYWNMVEQPLTFLKEKTLWPLSLYLPDISVSNAGESLAASVVTLLPALLIFLAGQNYLEQGIAASGLKE